MRYLIAALISDDPDGPKRGIGAVVPRAEARLRDEGPARRTRAR